MKKLLLVVLALTATTVWGASQQYYSFPDARKMYDNDRVLVFQNASGSRNYTGAGLKKQILAFPNISGDQTVKGNLVFSGVGRSITSASKLAIGSDPTYPGANVVPETIRVSTSTATGTSVLVRKSAASGSPTIGLYRSYGSDLSPTAITAASQGLGTIAFNGFDGTNFLSGAFINASTDLNAPATNSMPTRLGFSTTANGSSTPSGRMFILANGNVLLGSSFTDGAGSEKLQVTGAISATTTIKNGVYTVATLPTGTAGMKSSVSDATTTTFGAVVAGGGANFVPVYHDGTNWRIG